MEPKADLDPDPNYNVPDSKHYPQDLSVNIPALNKQAENIF